MGSNKSKPKKIAILGLDAAGKITILKQMNSEGVNIPEFPDPIPQDNRIYEYLVKTMDYNGMHFLGWDIGGQPRDQKMLRRMYLHEIDAVIYVIDSNDKDRLEESIEELYTVAYHFKNENMTPPKALLIFANKQDLPNAVPVETIKQQIKLSNEFKTTTAWHIEGSCASQNKGIQKGMDWLIDQFNK